MRKLWALKVRGGRREEMRRKTRFLTWKSLFFFLLFYNYSFASAVQRRMGELKLALPQRFQSLKMKKKRWEDINKVFSLTRCSVIGQDTLGVWFLEWLCYFVLLFYCDIWWVPIWYPLGVMVKKYQVSCHALPYKWKLHVGHILQLVPLWANCLDLKLRLIC